MQKKILIENISKIHTTESGVERIKRNLGISDNPVEYCILKLKNDHSKVSKKGKNFYVEADDCIITINSSSFTIITAHKSEN